MGDLVDFGSISYRLFMEASCLDESSLSDILYDMRTISIRSLQRETSAVLEAVSKGEEIVVTKRNRIMARILPPSPQVLQLKQIDFDKRFSQSPLPTKKGTKSPAEILQYMRSGSGE